MDTVTAARVRWTCPECGARLTSMAQDRSAAESAHMDLVREHLATFHPDDDVNPHAAAGWLAAAGHQVELWGGPHDGERVWCPPGDLPDVIGVHRTADGAVVPTRSATARRLPHVETYRRGNAAAAAARGRAVRYLFDRWTA